MLDLRAFHRWNVSRRGEHLAGAAPLANGMRHLQSFLCLFGEADAGC